jgi:glycosyltransferase involved in cell wall biosynthesis
LAVAGTVAIMAIALLPAVILARALWRRGARARRTGDRPRSLLILAYTTYSDAVAKGIMRDPNLWYNCGEMFQHVLVYVAIAPVAEEREVSSSVRYVQDGAILPNWEVPLAWTVLLLRYLRGWWRACHFAFSADVMLVNGPNRSAQIGIISKLVTDIPTLVFVEAFWEEILVHQHHMRDWQRFLTILWYRIVYRAFDAYTGTPTFEAAMYGRWGVRAERIFPYLHNVDVATLSVGAAKTRIPEALEDRQRPWVVTVGRLHQEKKSRDAVELQSKLAKNGMPGTGILVGDGEARVSLERLSTELGVHNRMVFMGQLSQLEGMAIAAASDFYFAPMQGNALIEAMASPSCIIAYDNKTHRIFVEDDHTAALVPEGDVGAAARMIVELNADSKRASRLRASACAEALRRYTAKNIADVWFAPFVSLYRSALS